MQRIHTDRELRNRQLIPEFCADPGGQQPPCMEGPLAPAPRNAEWRWRTWHRPYPAWRMGRALRRSRSCRGSQPQAWSACVAFPPPGPSPGVPEVMTMSKLLFQTAIHWFLLHKLISRKPLTFPASTAPRRKASRNLSPVFSKDL